MRPTDRGFASRYVDGRRWTTLGHAYGAVLLAALLLRHPILGLGDDITLRVACHPCSWQNSSSMTTTPRL